MFQSERFPSLQRRGGCGINRKSRSHRSAADGVVNHTTCLRMHAKHSLCSTTPARANSERDHFFMARPPLLGKGTNILDSSIKERHFEIGRLLHLKSEI